MSKQSKVQENYQQVNEFYKKIHSLFKQNPLGAEILELWKDHALMSPGDTNGKDLYSLGVVEGQKTFVRDIIQFIENAEGAK